MESGICQIEKLIIRTCQVWILWRKKEKADYRKKNMKRSQKHFFFASSKFGG